MKLKFVRFFEEIAKNDLPMVGGKGANLGEMINAGFPVPKGFCVTTQAYTSFLRYHKLDAFLLERLFGATAQNSNSISSDVRECFEALEMPEDIRQEIAFALRQSEENTAYAVRSSATAEDLLFASFAGQQDTYLNVIGEDAILRSVKSCWASLFNERAILYRLQNGIAHESVLMSVVVQKMILPDRSGILFTADPVSGHRDIISIDAGYGLGEALVSGLVSPDIYKFSKAGFTIVEKTISIKKIAILPLENGGTKQVDIVGAQSSAQVLNDAQIRELCKLGMQIEAHYGCPQDIEWCIENDSISIVQSRAITSLFPLPTPRPIDDALHVYFSLNHIQVMTKPISPLGIDLFKSMLPVTRKHSDAVDRPILCTAAGRIYADVTALMRYPLLRKLYPRILCNVDTLMAQSMQTILERPDFVNKMRHKKREPLPSLRYCLPILLRTVYQIVWKAPEGTVAFMDRYIRDRETQILTAIQAAAPGAERIKMIFREGNLHEDLKRIFPYVASGLFAFSALKKLEQRLLNTNQYANTIVQGLKGNVTTEMGLLIGDMADMVRSSPELLQAFQDTSYETLLPRLDLLPSCQEFRARFRAFIDKYGVRAPGEIDIANARWIENPEPLVKSILTTVYSAKPGVHRKDFQASSTQAQQTAEILIREVTEMHGKRKGVQVKRLIRLVQNTLPVREHHKFMMMRYCMIFKKALLEEAETLVNRGCLAHANDIFYLTYSELLQASQSHTDLKALITQRKEAYQHFEKLSPPRVMTSEGEAVAAAYQKENMPQGALVGIAASSGIVEGIAKVIVDPAEGELNHGEILIAPFTDPGWTPLFLNAAGLVTEIGGMLTHGTVIAREYGIPAVVGVPDATKNIRSGQKIRVNGDFGYMVLE